MRCATQGRQDRPKKERPEAAVETDIGHETTAEAERLIGGNVFDDFQAIEIEARRVALPIMGQAVAHRLNADPSDYQGPHLACGCGGEAHFVGRQPTRRRRDVDLELCRRTFSHAIQIVDIFHAKGHLFEVAKAICGPGSEIGQQWARKRREELDEGRIHDVITAFRSHAESCEEARKNTEYFSSNRLKQGGMHWTVNGANAILALRCAVESNRFDDFWERWPATVP